jgi:FtsP/CotA-like multicopper oxidase with cupredoxin domain
VDGYTFVHFVKVEAKALSDALMNRRRFLAAASAALACANAPLGALGLTSPMPPHPQADLRLRIAPCTLNIGRGVEIATVAYNGQVPGPTLRLKKDTPVTIDVTNATNTPDLVHWHGLTTDPLNDGAVEEGSRLIAPGATLRYHLRPNPSGTRWYHTHAMAMGDLSLAAYTGQFGFLLVDGAPDPGRHDREVNLAIHHWGAEFVPMVETMREQSQNVPQTSGSDVGYRYAAINAHMLGSGEPIRVKKGERILFRLLNASATENVVLALPGHSFRVIAMDGNPVPEPRSVEVLSLAVAERVDAIVEMNSPGVWVLGSTLKASRDMGLGVVVEYAGRSGEPVWRDPEPVEWDYGQFAAKNAVAAPGEIFTLTFRDAGALNGSRFDTWTLNGDAWPDAKPLKVMQGKRYRMLFRNASGDQHPIHLHRHSFEVTKVGEQTMSGLMKDVVNVMPLQTVAVDFVSDNPGDSLLHCHQQLHMDYGFMQIIRYVG